MSGQSRWRVICSSRKGASHVRLGIPNQDAIGTIPEKPTAEGEPMLVVAVADGHGSPKSFRSDRGSRFAVKVTTRMLTDIFERGQEQNIQPALTDYVHQKLPQDLVDKWRNEVDEDLKQDPFHPDEFSLLMREKGAAACEEVRENSRLAYGSTIVAAGVTEHLAVYLQLGDGDIFTVDEDGRSEYPLPGDSRLFANETTSLCGPKAASDFRIEIRPIAQRPPALVLLSTDGYPMSFRTNEGFLQVGKDLLDTLKSDGFDYVESNLGGWLDEASTGGSGDDMSVGLLCRFDVLKPGTLPLPITVTAEPVDPETPEVTVITQEQETPT